VSTDGRKYQFGLFDDRSQFVLHAERHVRTPPSMKTLNGTNTPSKAQPAALNVLISRIGAFETRQQVRRMSG
jgi:hypothetical protein